MTVLTSTLGYANGEKETLSVPLKKVITGMMPMKKTDDSHSHHNTGKLGTIIM